MTLAVCAIAITALLVMREFRPPAGQSTAAGEQTTVSGWRPLAAFGHRLGPERARVTVVVFSDFQCPACRELAGELKALRAEYPTELAVVLHHFPLRSHPFAVPAARASECAAAQGRFEAFHDELFADQASIGFAPWGRYAARAGVPDLASFERCASLHVAVGGVERDRRVGEELGVTGTPMFLVNGRRFNGTPPLEILRAAIRRELAGPRQ